MGSDEQSVDRVVVLFHILDIGKPLRRQCRPLQRRACELSAGLPRRAQLDSIRVFLPQDHVIEKRAVLLPRLVLWKACTIRDAIGQGLRSKTQHTFIDESLLHVGVVLIVHADCAHSEYQNLASSQEWERASINTINVVDHVAGGHCGWRKAGISQSQRLLGNRILQAGAGSLFLGDRV